MNDNQIWNFNATLINGNVYQNSSDRYVTYDMKYISPKTGTETTKRQYIGQANDLSSLLGISGTSTKSMSKRQLGGVDFASSIYIYPNDFETKDMVTDYLDQWNEDIEITVKGKVMAKEDRNVVKYTVTIGLVIGMVNTMIDIVSYALIGFTALSLIVSKVMIGFITYVSVVERIKEIGVIRSLGGRKKDVSHLFNAETFIIGLTSGIFGILITIGLSGIINLNVGHFAGIYTIAALPIDEAIIIIIVSVLLTSISGLIPAKAAARKNPVEALRTE